MSFQELKVDELKKVAEFFAVDVDVANEDHGATKKELLAALAAGDEPVTWDDYKNVYLESDTKKVEDKAAEAQAEAEKHVDNTEGELVDKKQAEEDSKSAAKEAAQVEEVLIKYERKNPTWQVGEYTFTKAHPYKSVPVKVAESLIRNSNGFRLALPSEVIDFYG